MKRALLFAILAAACGAQNESREAIKQAVSEVRTKPRVIVQIRLESSAYPTEKDLAVRHAIEKQIEEQHLGAIVGQESGPGHMDFTVEVEETVTSIPKLQKVLRDAGVADRSSLKIGSMSS